MLRIVTYSISSRFIRQQESTYSMYGGGGTFAVIYINAQQHLSRNYSDYWS